MGTRFIPHLLHIPRAKSRPFRHFPEKFLNFFQFSKENREVDGDTLIVSCRVGSKKAVAKKTQSLKNNAAVSFVQHKRGKVGSLQTARVILQDSRKLARAFLLHPEGRWGLSSGPVPQPDCSGLAQAIQINAVPVDLFVHALPGKPQNRAGCTHLPAEAPQHSQ